MQNINFLHTETELFKIPKSRLIMGLFAGLFFAFCFYAFLNLTRESVRILSLTKDYDLWILTDNEVSFYNLIFAYISVIFAQSICFSFWFDKPQKLFFKPKFQRITIVNDQRALNTFFLFWFSKLAVIYGVYFGWSFHGEFYAFSFYPKYNYIFVLIILVLFLQTWSSIRRFNKQHSLKWMFISMLIVSTIAFGLSKLNLIDYKSMNNIALQKNISFKYNLVVPESSCYESKFENRSLTKDIYVVRNKQQENSTPQIFVDNQEVFLSNLGLKISEFKRSFDEIDACLCTYQLHIDKSVKMKFINELKKEMANANAFRIAYAVVPTKAEYDKRYYKDYSFRALIPGYYSENYKNEDPFRELNNFENIIEIKISDSGECEINNERYSVNKIKQTIKDIIKRDPDYIVKFYINDNMVFSDYFNVISATKEAVNELRNEYSLLTYSKDFNNLETEEMNKAIKKYTFRILEFTSH